MRACFFILTLSILSSCVTDIANRYYLTQKLPARTKEEVTILYGKPQRSFEVIADFQSKGESESSLQGKAAEIGADAIIISRFGGSYSFGEQWAGTDSYAGLGDRVVGTAIRYKD